MPLSAGSGPARPFIHWWNTRGEWVEAPNVRRGGNSGVQLLRGETGSMLYVKRQTGHVHRSLRHPFGRPTVLREAEALRALATLAVPVPTLAYCGARNQDGEWQAILVTEALEGYLNLDAWYRQPHDPATRAAMLRELARTLARMHRGHWQHGCLYPKHIFVRSTENSAAVDVALLDLEKARRRLLPRLASRHDLAQLDRHRSPMPDADWRDLLGHYQRAMASRSPP
ncbi:lipopolysaccharide kinase InaA family protein [Thauera aromatica]|uniref:lipopolysaccharide kinase InaA family protein n=1 Tax=Thauera aromatica TaxID=59405 RepID=UPI001FFD6EA5|nr:lipopolysaccharide kinase InaA family protein [Thauera aromatica]MCK2097009.1 phosphotransferase [Thauera aromatica]